VGGSPRGREPMASSNSRRLSSSTGSPISCRRRGSTGIATTVCETIPGLCTLGNLRLLRTSCPRAGADPENPHASWRPASGRERRRLQRLSHMCRNLPDRPRLGDERDQPDVTATTRAFERKLLPHPRHELGPVFCAMCRASGRYPGNRPSAISGSRRMTASGWLIARHRMVALPVGVPPTRTGPSQWKCSSHESRRG